MSRRTYQVAAALALPVLVGLYLILFWRSVAPLPIQSAGYPKVLIVGIAVLLPVVAIRDLRRSRAVAPAESLQDGDEPSAGIGKVSRATRAVVVTMGGLAVYVLAISVVGTYVASAVFVPGIAFALGYRRPSGLLRLAVLAVVLVYGAAAGMGLQLPGT
jgi:hypothetical protein